MSNRKDLKAYVKYDGTGRVIPSSIALRKKKPSGKFKPLVDPTTYECCNPIPIVRTTTSITTTTTTSVPLPKASGGIVSYDGDYTIHEAVQ